MGGGRGRRYQALAPRCEKKKLGVAHRVFSLAPRGLLCLSSGVEKMSALPQILSHVPVLSSLFLAVLIFVSQLLLPKEGAHSDLSLRLPDRGL